MTHDLGDGVATFFGRNLPVHSPLRYYYMLRNGVWVLRQPWIGWRWRVIDIRRLFLMYVVFSFFVGDRFKNWKMMSLGLFHGLCGRMGKYKDR
jgi:rhamnosyltransferase